jgi:hypothetical protein
MTSSSHCRCCGLSTSVTANCKRREGEAPKKGHSSIWARNQLRVAYADQYRNNGSKACGRSSKQGWPTGTATRTMTVTEFWPW